MTTEEAGSSTREVPTGFTVPLVLDGVESLSAAVGAKVGPTAWLQIDQERVNGFAEATGDHQWIHVDPERAKKSVFGSTTAHGYLTLSLCNFFLSQLIKVQNVSMGVNYGANRVRFASPVKVGSRIRGRAEILDGDEVAGGVQATILITAEVEGSEKPACVVETLNRWMI